jgi:hypothetical protein
MITRSSTASNIQYNKEEIYLQSFTIEHELSLTDIQLLQSHNYLSNTPIQCKQHKQELTFCERRAAPDGWEYRCSKCPTDSSISLRTNTMLFNKKYSFPQLITIIRLMENKASWSIIAKEAQLSKRTVSRIYDQLVTRMQKKLDTILFTNEYIFDKNSNIQIDEAKVKWQGDTMEYCFSDRVEQENGDWILGIADKTSDKVYFSCITDRKANSIIEVIEDVVEHGATITTDALSTYEVLNQNYTHLVINKKRDGFCSCKHYPGTHINVNYCECHWCQLRKLAHLKSITHPQHVPHLVIEYMFRSYNCNFFDIIKTVKVIIRI